jgi:hypothetical protein
VIWDGVEDGIGPHVPVHVGHHLRSGVPRLAGIVLCLAVTEIVPARNLLRARLDL